MMTAEIQLDKQSGQLLDIFSLSETCFLKKEILFYAYIEKRKSKQEKAGTCPRKFHLLIMEAWDTYGSTFTVTEKTQPEHKECGRL